MNGHVQLATKRAIARADIARSFGQAAPHYDVHAGLQREVADALLLNIPAEAAPHSVLDLGCGTAYCAEALRALYPAADLFALDLALPMLQEARQRLPGMNLLCADAEALPLGAGSVDLVVSSLALQWCAEPGRVFAELFRIARPGASVALSTFGPATLREVAQAWAQASNAVHVNTFVPFAELERAARAAGFTFHGTSESKRRGYGSLLEVSRELKGIGAHNMNGGRAAGLTGRRAFAQAERAFRAGCVADAKVPVTYEIYYLNLRKPS